MRARTGGVGLPCSPGGVRRARASNVRAARCGRQGRRGHRRRWRGAAWGGVGIGELHGRWRTAAIRGLTSSIPTAVSSTVARRPRRARARPRRRRRRAPRERPRRWWRRTASSTGTTTAVGAERRRRASRSGVDFEQRAGERLSSRTHWSRFLPPTGTNASFVPVRGMNRDQCPENLMPYFPGANRDLSSRFFL